MALYFEKTVQKSKAKIKYSGITDNKKEPVTILWQYTKSNEHHLELPEDDNGKQTRNRNK